MRLQATGKQSNASIVSGDAGTHRSPFRRVKTQTKCRKNVVNAGMVPTNRNTRATCGRRYKCLCSPAYITMTESIYDPTQLSRTNQLATEPNLLSRRAPVKVTLSTRLSTSSLIRGNSIIAPHHSPVAVPDSPGELTVIIAVNPRQSG